MAKKTIIKANTQETKVYDRAYKILNAAKGLLDQMESTPSGFLNANDLGPLYEELLDVIPDLQYNLERHTLELQTDKFGIITRQ